MTPLYTYDDINKRDDIYYVDANILYRLFSGARKGSYDIEIVQAIQSIMQKDSLIITSTLSFDEIYGVVRRAIINTERDKLGLPKETHDKDVIARIPLFYDMVASEVERIKTAFLDSLPSVICGYNNCTELLEASVDFSRRYRVGQADIKHLTISKAYDIRHFVTADSDLAWINDPETNIYLPKGLYAKSYTVVSPGTKTPIPRMNIVTQSTKV